MGDDAENEEAALLSRLNALKKSSVSLQHHNNPLVLDGQESNLSERFQKLSTSGAGRSLRQPKDLPPSGGPVSQDGASAPPSPTLEELLAELNIEEEQQQLHSSELVDAAKLLAEAKRVLPSDEDATNTIASKEPFAKSAKSKAEELKESEHQEDVNDGSEGNEEAEAAAALQRILDEVGMEEVHSGNNDGVYKSPTTNVERCSSSVNQEVENAGQDASIFPKAPIHLSPRSPVNDVFPTPPTAAPRAPACQKDTKFTDAEIESWCIICLADATIRCLGCAGDLYCQTCWKEGHTEPDAGYEERQHKAVGLRRNPVGST